MRDSTTRAAEVQARVQEELGGTGRLRLAFELSAAARALALAGLHARRPAWTREQLARALHLPPAAATSPESPPRAP
jgi:hypothetical protein